MDDTCWTVCLRHSILRGVISVVSSNGTELLVTLGFGFIVVYIYTVIGFLFFNNQYSLDGHEGCEYLFSCFLMHIDYGMRAGPSFDMAGAAIYGAPYEKKFWHSLAPWLFSFSYNLLVILILVAIVTGIIIDAFSVQRGQIESANTKLLNVCFICGLTRVTFESKDKDFNAHWRTFHSAAMYVAFHMHIKATPKTKRTALENYVATQMQRKTIDYFPLGRHAHAHSCPNACFVCEYLCRLAGTRSGLTGSGSAGVWTYETIRR